jgi:hypothetical protein
MNRSVYRPTRAEQETTIRWDREDPQVRIWSANPVVWRRMERLESPVVKATRWADGSPAGRWYEIPLGRFRWGLRRVGRPGARQNPPRSRRTAREERSLSPSDGGASTPIAGGA